MTKCCQSGLVMIGLGLLLAGCVDSTALTIATASQPATITAPTADLPSLTPFQPAPSTGTPTPMPPSTQPAHTLTLEVSMPIRASSDPLRITIVYNNIAADPRLATSWGFSAYIEYQDQVVLFDTGTNGQILLQNMQALEIDPASIQVVVLSHAHQDHTGGLSAFLAVSSRPPVYLLSSFGNSFIEQTRQATEVIEASPGLGITEDILTTGEINQGIPEQALVIRTRQGLVVVTGCAHPGIVRIIELAVALTGEPVYFVMGGFHLRDSNRTEIRHILDEFRRLGVRRVAPSHCTGELAIRMFAEEYEEDFLHTGAGSVITIDEIPPGEGEYSAP